MGEAEYWEKIWSSYQSIPVSDFAERAYQLIQGRGLKTLLDLGCGTGQDAIYFADRGLEVTAVDFAASGIKILKARNTRINCIRQDIRHTGFKDDSFDVIYSHLSLHYFDDETTGRIFANLHRTLRQGGLLFVKCKSTDDRLYGQGEKVGENMFKKGHTRHFFTREYMAEKLTGFGIINIRQSSSVRGENRSAFIEAIAVK